MGRPTVSQHHKEMFLKEEICFPQVVGGKKRQKVPKRQVAFDPLNTLD